MLITRRTLFKFATLLPFVGPIMAKALAQSTSGPKTAPLPYLPDYFPKWNKAVDGLEEAGAWARDIEWSRIPPNIVLPKPGEIWEAVQDCEVPFQASISRKAMPWVLSCSGLSPAEVNLLLGFGTARLRRGERVRILESGPKPITIRFVPLRCDELHESIVPDKLRCAPGYSGFTFHLKTIRTVSDLCTTGSHGPIFFNEAFRVIPNATPGG